MGQWLVAPAQMRRSWPFWINPTHPEVLFAQHEDGTFTVHLRLMFSYDAVASRAPDPAVFEGQVPVQARERKGTPSSPPGPRWQWHSLWHHHLKPPSWNSSPHSISGRRTCLTHASSWFLVMKCCTLCAQNLLCLLVMGEQPVPKRLLAGS